VDDAEYKKDAVFTDAVVHDAVVADAKAVEGVLLPADCLRFLARDATGSGCCAGELFESGANPLALGRR
jgi:hypothetical protein